MSKEIKSIQRLVGDISESDLRYVEYYVSEHFSIFIPSVGFCQYAITPQHTHPAYSFILFFSKDQGIVSPEIEIYPNHYLVTAMSPDIPHEEKEGDTFTRYIAILIEKDYYEKIHIDYCGKQPEKYIWKQFITDHEIMTYIKKFMTEYDNKKSGYDNILKALGEIITHLFIRNLLKIDVKVDYITDKFEIENVIEYLHQHYWEKITIATLAQITKMSDAHFIRVFKKETGLSPMEFLIKVRIEKAKKFLRNSTENITEIALECGFSSTAHFSSSFTKLMGVNPSTYRKSFS